MAKIIETLPEKLEDFLHPWSNAKEQGFHVVMVEDAYPVSPGHRLFVPTYNDMYILEYAFAYAVGYGAKMVALGEWDGYNVGINIGEAAGQTVEWPHIHLIPRFKNDVEDPIGGVRNVIPGKGNYKK